MAILISKATGDFTAPTTWGVADTVSASLSFNFGTMVTTGYQQSSPFTPGAITIDGVAVYVNLRLGSTGTLTTGLHQGGVLVVGTDVSIPITSLPNLGVTSGNGIGWVFFKYPAPVTLAAATAYTLGAKTSSPSMISMRASSGPNWTRYLRTTTEAAPAAGDTLIVAGSWNVTLTPLTVTMNNTATTAFGTVYISTGGILLYGTVVATIYYLKTLDVIITCGGTMKIGSLAAPIPASSTAILEFAATGSVTYGLVVQSFATFESYGAAKTSWTNLTADAGAGATSFVVASTSGWATGDEVVFSPTLRTVTQYEQKLVLSVPTATTFTTSATGFVHTGSNPALAGQVGNLSRNVKIRGISFTSTFYLEVYDSAVFSASYTEFYYLGASSPANKVGITLETTTGSAVFAHCSTHDHGSSAFSLSLGTNGNANITIDDHVVYNPAGTNFRVLATSLGANVVVTNNLFIGGITGMSLNAYDFTCTGNRIAGASTTGILMNSAATAATPVFNNNTVNSCAIGVNFAAAINSATFGSCTVYFSTGTSGGLTFSQSPVGPDLVLDSWTLFGNNLYNITVTQLYGRAVLKSFVVNSQATFSTPTGLNCALATTSLCRTLILVDCSFGATVAHVQDLMVSALNLPVFVELNNTVLASATEFASSANLGDIGYVSSQKHEGITGSHKCWKRYGLITTDNAIYDTLAPSMRIAPNSASKKVQGGVLKFAIASGQTSTVSVRVRKSVSGDGAAYNGNNPRFILLANPAAGIAADTVIATATAASAGAWETLTGTTLAVSDNAVLEFCVDCDGTAGWVNVDNLSVGGASPDTTGLLFWESGQPQVLSGQSGGVFNFAFG